LKEKYPEEWKYIRFETRTDFNELTSEQKKRLNELIFADSDFIRMYELIKKASDMPSCRFNLRYEDGWAIELPHLSKIREIARILGLRIILLTEQNKYNKALESGRIGLRLVNALRDEPFYISQLVRMGCGNVIFYALTETISDIPADSILIDASHGLITEIRLINYNLFLTKGLNAEIAWGNNTFKRIHRWMFSRDKNIMEYWFIHESDNPLRIIFWKLYTSFLGKPCVKKDNAFYLRYMTNAIEFSFEPYYKVKNRINETERKLDRSLRWKYPLSSMVLPSFGSFHSQQAEYISSFDVLRLALILKIYKIEKGIYPDSLDALMPDYLLELPKDPFIGKDYIYRKEGDGFIVYGVGMNEKDDGGLFERRSWGIKKDDLICRSSK
ncbi:MAG: hypothetical protein HY606_14455, partial [Planctomycetes bacterium]|nr:hypothetical protein [Planctomycetota bacterium]